MIHLITAGCILHNICQMERDNLDEMDEMDANIQPQDQPLPHQHLPNEQGQAHHHHLATTYRNALVDYFTENELPR